MANPSNRTPFAPQSVFLAKSAANSARNATDQFSVEVDLYIAAHVRLSGVFP